MIHIQIDGIDIFAENEETILEAALRNGINIPNLCYNKKTSCTAGCRLCIVNVEGRPANVPSCTVKAEEGMKITAFSEKLEAQRKMILDLLLSMHNDDCINCVKDASCDLQDLAFRYDLARDKRKFPQGWKQVEKYSDYSSQILDYDAAKCILCQKCIKACWEIQGKGILSLENRGIKTVVSTGFDQWIKSKCDGCGECIQSCPVGALAMKPVYGIRHRIKDIDSTVRTTCPYCGVGCQLDIAVKNNAIISVCGADSLPNFGSTCVKGRFGLQYSGDKNRLAKPLIRKNGKLVEATWDEAISFAASKLNEIKSEHGSDAIGGLASARCTNEENYLFQKFIRSVIGTNNVDHCARLCHSSSVASLGATIGSSAMTNPISDFEKAEVIFVIGSNTTETHPVISNSIKRAVLKNKVKLIVADPREIDLVRYSTLWLRPNNGTDIAWLNGLIHVILKKNLQNDEYIKNRTEGFDALKVAVEKYTPEHVERLTGIPADKLIEAAGLYGKADRASIVWAMGITQHAHGTNNVNSIVNLALITGNIGKEGAGVNPLRGQNNVQGSCDMGALPDSYPGAQKVNDKLIHERFENVWRSKLSSVPGLPLTEMINQAAEGKLKALYVMGENPVVTEPNLNHLTHSLKNLNLLIVQDIFLTETAQLADVVFPATSSLEKDGTFTNTERRVLAVKKVLNSKGESKDDWQIIQSLAVAMGASWSYLSWKDIMREINSVTPQYAGITPERILNDENLQWPCPESTHPGTPVLHLEKFTRGRGLISVVEYAGPEEPVSGEYPFVMSTGRSLYHYHSGSMTRRSKALNDFVNDPYFEINSDDMNKIGISDGEIVKLISLRGEIEMKTKASERVAPGNIFLPFHFAEAAANKLTLDALDPVSKIPEFKVCAANIKKL